MLWVSAIAVIICLGAFIVDGCFPFSMPISLLGDPQHLTAYRLVVLSLVAVAVFFVTMRCRVGDLFDALLGGVVTVLLIALLGTPNHVRGHDQLAAVAMVATSVMSFGIAQRLGDRRLLSLTVFSLVSCSLLFTGSMVAVGVVEGIVLATAVLAMNLAGGVPVPAGRLLGGRWYFSWRWPSGLGLPWWWRPGMGAGLCWGVFCLLVCGTCRAFDGGSVMAGPLLLISCTALGFLAWRDEMFFTFRAPLVFGGFAAVMGALSGLGLVALSTTAVVGLFVIMGATLVFMSFVHLLTS